LTRDGELRSNDLVEGQDTVQSLKIILLCVAAAVVYGVGQDQVTARVCVEYFTVGHAPIFATESPTLLALEFGTRATWWVGLILGVLAAGVSRTGSWPKVDAVQLIRPLACLIAVMAVASLLAGITGYRIAMASGFVLPEPLGPRIVKAHHGSFFADSLAHLAAYGVGLLGGLIVCAGVLVQRRRTARAAPSTKDGPARMDLFAERWIVVVSRWTAGTIAIPLFVLVVLLTLGDGVPNPLTASRREIVFVAVVLMMLFGLVLAWKWEGVGSLLILAGLILFATANEAILLDIVLAPWLVTGLLYLVCWRYGTTKGTRRFVCFPRPSKTLPAPSDPGQGDS
jgi:hypothetical protein